MPRRVSSQFVARLIVVVGFVLLLLGLVGGFTFVSCGGPEPRSCHYIYTLDLLAGLVGVVSIFAGTLALFLRHSHAQ